MSAGHVARPKALASALAGCLALVVATPAHATQPQYSLTDVGTLGGEQTDASLPGRPLTTSGAVIGISETARGLVHAFSWRAGAMTDLGALPGRNSSTVFQVNAGGVGAGSSENGARDPLTGTRVTHAVLFVNGRVLDLGTLRGGRQSFALAVNDRGQVAGLSSNGVPDPFSVLGWGTQTRSFIWQHGVMRDIGTLGGPDTAMEALNARGQIAGSAYTSTTLDPLTNAPSTHPFLYSDGRMRDLGTLGGTSAVFGGLNDLGQGVGQSSLAGDDRPPHPFLWDGARLRDLGTLGGGLGSASFIDNAGRIVGFASLADETTHAFLFTRGTMTDLSGPGGPPCTGANAVNAAEQVVGNTCLS